MTLILWVRAAISGVPRFRRVLEFLFGKRRSDENLRPPATGYESDRSPQHCRSLLHTLNSQAVRGDSNSLSVKAASVIAYRYIQSCGRTREFNADGLGSRMSGYVGEGLLNNAIQPDLDC